MVDAMAGCVWGWPRPSHVVGSAEGKAGCLTKAVPAAGRSAWATIQACTVVASTIFGVVALDRDLPDRAHPDAEPRGRHGACGELDDERGGTGKAVVLPVRRRAERPADALVRVGGEPREPAGGRDALA